MELKHVVSFDVLMLLVSESNLREHFSVKARRVRAQREQLVTCVMLARGMPRVVFSLPKAPRKYPVAKWSPPYEPPLHVLITRCAPRLLDDDNAVRSAKAVRDQLAELLGVDDRDPRVTWEVQQQERERSLGPLVRVEIFARRA